MAEFDYGNARLRAMKGRLLSPQTLDALADSGSISGLITALSKTVYQKSLEAALARVSGRQCIDEALHTDLTNTIGKIRTFYQEEAATMVLILLRSYDIHNLKAILRGVTRHAPTSEILSILIPVGEIEMNLLRQLAQLNTSREVVDMLASMGLPFAAPLLAIRAEKPGADLADLELALEKWYYKESHEMMKNLAADTSVLANALLLEVDLKNVLTVLRIVRTAQEHDATSKPTLPEPIETLLIQPGRIKAEQLMDALHADTLVTAVEALSSTYLSPALYEGLNQYAQSKRLSDVEHALNRFRLQWMAKQMAKDPLGIGVVLGYLALKVNEINNLRWIARGISLGLKADAIRTGLVMV